LKSDESKILVSYSILKQWRVQCKENLPEVVTVIEYELTDFLIYFDSDEKIALLGAIQSLFEGSMYTFVFLWTPALSPHREIIPHGFIFATFMLSSMLGSSLASRLSVNSSIKVESYMQVVFVVSACSLLLPVLISVSKLFLICPFYFSPILSMRKTTHHLFSWKPAYKFNFDVSKWLPGSS
jgi:hypothetical protein